MTHLMSIILNFVTYYYFCRCNYLCITLHPPNRLNVIPFFMVPPHSLLRAVVYKFLWDDTENMLRLMGISPNISLLSKMDLVIIK